MRDDGFLSDISVNGCCVMTRSLLFGATMRVMIKPDTLEAIPGVVRWADGHRAGVEFDAPLYPPVVEHLIEHYPPDRPVTITSCP